ncbi:MAG: c-type cytochrome [Gemmatimonadaceae bacterium]|nr:c-type cytochrome [Gemmatimonadaceae bacterium]
MKRFLSLLLLVPPAAPSVSPTPAPLPRAAVTAHTNSRWRAHPEARGAATPRSPGAIRPGPAAVAAVAAVMDPEPLTPAATRKVEALLRDHLPCLGCHTVNGSGGKIGPDLSSVRTRRSSEYIAAMLADPQRVVPSAAMPRPLIPAGTRDLLVRYLATRPGNATGALPVPAPAPPTATVDGKALYAKWCAACHGASGKGDGPNASSLPVKPTAHSDREAMARRPDDSLYDTIAGGGEIMNRSPRMPAFGGSLSTTEIRALVAHIRSLCGCQGPAWSRDDARTP